MTDLADFLLARIAEDEAAARAATQGAWKLWGMSVMADQDGTSNVDTALDVAHTAHEAGLRTFNAIHIVRHQPANVLAECEAKRRIVAGQPYQTAAEAQTDGGLDRWRETEWLLRLLALPYAAHPDYRPEWAV